MVEPVAFMASEMETYVKGDGILETCDVTFHSYATHLASAVLVAGGYRFYNQKTV
jgi:hypothetical protein